MCKLKTIWTLLKLFALIYCCWLHFVALCNYNLVKTDFIKFVLKKVSFEPVSKLMYLYLSNFWIIPSHIYYDSKVWGQEDLFSSCFLFLFLSLILFLMIAYLIISVENHLTGFFDEQKSIFKQKSFDFTVTFDQFNASLLNENVLTPYIWMVVHVLKTVFSKFFKTWVWNIL